MKPQKNPNAWSCLPTAFAISQGDKLDDWLKLIGHDGSEIVRAGLPDPICRKGFHPNEMIYLCVGANFAVTRIELVSQATPGGQYVPTVFDTGGERPFLYQMFNSRGVLDVRTATGVGHALSYEGCGGDAIICDPATGKVFEFRGLEDTSKRGIFITALWRIDEMKE